MSKFSTCLGLSFALLALPAGAADPDAGPAGQPVGLEALITRIQQRDPELGALRRRVLSVEAAGERDLRPRDPEIRLGYSSTSHSAIPDPFTEVREETITRTETQSSQDTLSGTERASERRTDLASPTDSELRTSSGSLAREDRASETIQAASTRTTVREVTPGRRSTTIRETVYESTSERSNGTETRAEATSGAELRAPIPANAAGADATRFRVNGSSDRAGSTRGSETSRVVEQRVEEQVYNYDSYEGSDDYSVELRLYPSHPMEKRARRGRARADTRIAEYEAETRAHELAHDVRVSFVDLQLLEREGGLFDKRIAELNREVSLQKDLYEAGRGSIDQYADSRVDAIDARLDRDAVQAKADAIRDRLAARAGLDDPARIDLSGGLAVARVRPEDLDRDRLVDAAWLQRRELGRLEAEDQRLAQDLALVRAGRTPWLSLLSGRYTYEERYGGKYRDEYSVVAGVSIPVFRWFGNDGALLRKSREGLARDLQVLRERIELDVTHALRRLGRARDDLAAYADEHLAFRKQLQSTLDSLPDDVPAAREQRVRLGQTLVTLQNRELKLTRAYADAVLALEKILGAPVDEVLQSPASPPSTPEPKDER